MLDGVRIAAKPFNMTAKTPVLRLQVVHLHLQVAYFMSLCAVRGQTILPEHDVVSNSQRQHAGKARRNLAARSISTEATAAWAATPGAQFHRT